MSLVTETGVGIAQCHFEVYSKIVLHDALPRVKCG